MRFLWLIVVLAALLGGGAYLWSQEGRRGENAPDYSISRTDDRGAALVFRLYRGGGLAPRAWEQELTRLKEPGLLILLAPARTRYLVKGVLAVGSEGDVLPYEVEALDEWVARGNVAVIMSPYDNPIFQGLGLNIEEPEALSDKNAEPSQASALALGVGGIRTQTRLGIRYGRKKTEAIPGMAAPEPTGTPIPPEQWAELFVKRDGPLKYPQVAAAARGRGLYVVVNDVFPASNLGVTMADNARFMLNLARLKPAGGAIWFDEYHKRNPERGFVAYLRERGMVPVLVYLLLLVGLVFWRTGVRFGPPEPLVASRERESGEYLRAVAALYRNAGMAREALAAIYGDFCRRLVGALRVDGLTDLDEVGRRYEARTGRPALEAREVLIQTEAALARPKLEEAEALQFCARLTRLDEQLRIKNYKLRIKKSE